MKMKIMPAFLCFLFTLITFPLSESNADSNKPASKDSITIAVAGPLAGDKGRRMLNGIRMQVDAVNEAGGIGGKKIVLKKYDDQGNENEARRQARKIVASNALLVLGHRSSDTSIAAGKIYEEYKIPAITGTATADKVTRGRDNYFRVIFTNTQQGKLLAYYAKTVLGYKSFSIIYIDDEYGNDMKKAFLQASKDVGIMINEVWDLSKDKKKRVGRIKYIVENLDAKETDALMLATRDVDAVPIIKAIKDKGLDISIIGGASIGKGSFANRFKNFPLEQQSPGYYTDGIYTSSYFIFDVAGQRAQEFKREYLEKFGDEPSGDSVSYYDVAGLAIEAIKNSYEEGETLAAVREKIRKYLAGLNNKTGKAYKGATGDITFDSEGNALRPSVPFALFSNQKLISAPVQFNAIVNAKELAYLKKKDKEGKLDEKKDGAIKIGDNYMKKTNVVYTGIKINEISALNMEELTYDLDFYLWFRFEEDAGLDNIQFLNSVKPVKIGAPVVETKGAEGLNYRLYRIKGRFRATFDPENYAYGENMLKLQFRHKEFSQEKLIFVEDVLGIIPIEGDSLKDRKEKSQMLHPSTGWKIKSIIYYLDVMETPTFGNPKYFNKSSKKVEFSRFNSNISIKKEGLSLRGIIPGNMAANFLFLACLTILLAVLEKKERFKKYARYIWFIQFITAVFLLLAAEVVFVQWQADKMNLYLLNLVIKTIDAMWWVLPGIFLDHAIKVFLFTAIKEKTGREIPNIVRLMTSFLIYLLVFFGITAFIFDYKITSLLATSGVIAMIIGLAVQINISNIFSGIAINVEHPFRIGNWVKIGDFDEGKVVDITWRSVRIQTRDHCIISIPNSTAAETIVRNFTAPDNLYLLNFTVNLPPAESPEKIKELLRGAVGSVQGILKGKEPVVKFLGVKEWSAEYNIMLWINDYSRKKTYIDDVWQKVWECLKEAGIEPAMVP